jgi:hypothetical protein
MTPQTLTIDNYGRINVLQYSRLKDDAAAAQATFTPENAQGFLVGRYVVFGGPGVEDSELISLQSITNGVGTLSSNLARLHSRFESLTVLFGSQLEVWKAANVNGTLPADDTFSVVGVAISISPDQKTTQFTDPDGGEGWWYKFVYLDPATNTRTNLADSASVRGGNYGNYCSIDDIRTEAGLQTNRNISDGKIDKKRQAAQSEVNATLVGSYTLPFSKPVNPLIADITSELAAGMLLLGSYGPITVLNSANGQQKVDAARARLERINNRELVLTDGSGNDISTPDSQGLRMWPDPTTADTAASDGGGNRMFRVSDIEGYEGRNY